ncbi:Hypothetical predicted protein [Scomber scombrus]|uniref:Uncharacterized protein n=1 Tax=Scomber scombrus TaxID=13677 RepID=A0AAV1PAC2_SCOSC
MRTFNQASPQERAGHLSLRRHNRTACCVAGPAFRREETCIRLWQYKPQMFHRFLILFIHQRAVGHQSDADTNHTYSFGFGLHCTIPAQLGSAAAAMRYQEEKEHGGNVPSQCRGEETNRISRI